MRCWLPRNVAIRLGATFLLVTLVVALPLTLWFDHYARSMIEASVEQAAEADRAEAILEADVVADAFDRVRTSAVAVVSLSAFLAAGLGALIAVRWRRRMRGIVERGQARAFRAQNRVACELGAAEGAEREAGEDELDAVERQLLATVDQLGRSQWLLDSVDDMVMLVDPDGGIRHGNAATGHRCASCLVPDCGHATAPSVIGPALWRTIRQGLARGEAATLEQELDIGGRSFPALVTYRPLGEWGLVKVTDLTEYRRLKEHVERLQALSALGEMSTELAHEIKNNVAPVRLICHVAPLSESDRAAIMRSLDQIRELVDDVMAFGMGRSAEARTTGLAEAVEEWGAVVRDEAQAKGVQLDTAAVEPAQVQLPAGFRIVYANLVRNAVQATGEGGRVKVEGELDEAGGLILQVSDDGPGIPEELRDRLFEPFATSRSGGTGLGLALVYRYVREAGGDITWQSPPGGGTTFTVYYPGVAAPAAPVRMSSG